MVSPLFKATRLHGHSQTLIRNIVRPSYSGRLFQSFVSWENLATIKCPVTAVGIITLWLIISCQKNLQSALMPMSVWSIENWKHSRCTRHAEQLGVKCKSRWRPLSCGRGRLDQEMVPTRLGQLPGTTPAG